MMNGTTCSPASFITNTSDSQKQLLRKQCRESLYFFCKAVLGFKDFVPNVHLKSGNFIQDQEKRRKLFMLPRGFMKSHLATIGYPIWLLIQEPRPPVFWGSEERILLANATAENAENFLAKIQSVFERNAVFQWLFPELIPDFTSKQTTWNTREALVPRKNDYPEPTITAAGAGAAIVSRHFTRIILDDLINEKHAVSPALMRSVIDWYTYTESLLRIPSEDEIIVIGTRWGFNDLYSHIEETEGEWSAATPLGYAKYVRSALENDRPIFPERFNEKELARLRDKYQDYMYSCLYLNNPRQPGVNDFDTNWLEYYTFADKGKLKLSDGRLVDPNDMQRVAIVDIATSLRKDADYSAVSVVGVDKSRRVFLLDSWHARLTTKHLVDNILKLASRWHVQKIYYEDTAQQKLIQYPLEERIKETGQFFRVEGIKSGNKKSKEDRIRMCSTYFQQHRVYIRPSMSDFIKEYSDFPLGKHDDLIDSFAYFPRCVRFYYEEEEEQLTPDQRRDRDEDSQYTQVREAELDIILRGRSVVTGY